MTIDNTKNPLYKFPQTVDSPARKAYSLTTAMLSDTVDLPTYAKSMRVYNASGNTITLMVTPIGEADDTSAGAVPLSFVSGAAITEHFTARRIWSTGSTGLSAGLTATTVEVVLITL